MSDKGRGEGGSEEKKERRKKGRFPWTLSGGGERPRGLGWLVGSLGGCGEPYREAIFGPFMEPPAHELVRVRVRIQQNAPVSVSVDHPPTQPEVAVQPPEHHSSFTSTPELPTGQSASSLILIRNPPLDGPDEGMAGDWFETRTLPHGMSRCLAQSVARLPSGQDAGSSAVQVSITPVVLGVATSIPMKDVASNTSHFGSLMSAQGNTSTADSSEPKTPESSQGPSDPSLVSLNSSEDSVVAQQGSRPASSVNETACSESKDSLGATYSGLSYGSSSSLSSRADSMVANINSLPDVQDVSEDSLEGATTD